MTNEDFIKINIRWTISVWCNFNNEKPKLQVTDALEPELYYKGLSPKEFEKRKQRVQDWLEDVCHKYGYSYKAYEKKHTVLNGKVDSLRFNKANSFEWPNTLGELRGLAAQRFLPHKTDCGTDREWDNFFALFLK